MKANVASVRADRDVGGGDQAEAAGPGRPGDPGDTGFGHSQIAASTSPSIAAGTVPPARAAAVSLRSAPEQKTGPVWRQHDHPDRVVGDRRGQRVEQLGHQRRWTARCGCAGCPG